MYLRNSYYADGVKLWIPWQPIATNTKTSFSCTPKSGYSIGLNNNYIINNLVIINLEVSKTDSSTFPLNTQFVPVTLPSNIKPNYWMPAKATTRNDGVTGNYADAVFYQDGNIYAKCFTNGVTLAISGVFVLA